ncbi:hypothetical protein NPIL_147191 [Nephila pilipes]|uniref:C2H2-type domain-containing protein n=1 Tax=Nephila pilipes TaxID=299642 RepID=A0A8X6QLI5_NEPPI|nr:hypothetical protein NPIL_147191 [Nephila pilipes]
MVSYSQNIKIYFSDLLWNFNTSYSDSLNVGTEKNNEVFYKVVGKQHYCLLCSYSSLVKTNIIRHVRSHTNERPHCCPICNKSFITKESCQLHIRTHSGEQPYVCNICGKAFSQRGPGQQKLREDAYYHWPDHKKVQRRCVVCKGKVVLSLSGVILKASLQTLQHFDDLTSLLQKKFYYCSMCSYRTCKTTCLKNHERTHTGERPTNIGSVLCSQNAYEKVPRILSKLFQKGCMYSCSLCSYSSPVSYHVKNHIRTHTGERPFPCTVCNKKFSSKTNLNVHFRLHTGELPFECPVCKKRFNEKRSMMLHLVNHK